jgi:hypothetical protein
MQIGNILTVAYFVLVVYAFSGGLLLGITDYPLWKLISAEDFPAFHRSYVRRTSIFYVPFVFLGVLVNVVLIWFHHPAMSTPLIGIATVLYLFIVVVTATLVIPIHKQLDQAKSVELIDRIVSYHLYLRVIPGLIKMVAVIILLHQVVSASTS